MVTAETNADAMFYSFRSQFREKKPGSSIEKFPFLRDRSFFMRKGGPVGFLGGGQ